MSFRGMLGKVGLFSRPEGWLELTKPVVATGGLVGPLGQGKVFYLDPGNGSNSNDGRTPKTAFLTLAYAYTKLTANQNDTLVYLQDNTSLSIVDTLEWAKSYTHFIGVCPPTRVAQRARIFNSGNTTASTPLLKISASGCMFSNFYIFQGSAVATVGCIEVTGGRNYFENVHIAGPGHATMAGGANSYALKLNGASENTFKNCTIGVDTVKRTGANSMIWVDGASTRNIFEDCRVVSYAETNSYVMVKVNDTTAIDRFLHFKGCLFYNFWANHVDKLLSCFSVPASVQTHDIILQDCIAVGIDEWESGDRAQIWITGGTPAAGTAGSGGTGIAVTPS